jgi:regulator of protease activity HflC (stomatin/prohibitin superfamily)
VLYTVPQSHCVVMERLGRFHRVQGPGLRIRLPLLESIKRLDTWGHTANKLGYLVELSEQQTDTPARLCQTKDNAEVTANASVYWRIIDARRAIYEVDVLPQAVTDIALNALRSNIGSMELDAVLSNRQQLNERIAAQLSPKGQKWGIHFSRVEIQELSTSEAVSQAMLRQMDAERRRRAVVLDADGKASYDVRLAEAERQGAILRAEGRARALELLAEAEVNYLRLVGANIGTAAATQLLLAQKSLDGLQLMTQSPAHKVFMPNSIAGLLSLGDLLHGASHELDRAAATQKDGTSDHIVMHGPRAASRADLVEPRVDSGDQPIT